MTDQEKNSILGGQTSPSASSTTPPDAMRPLRVITVKRVYPNRPDATLGVMDDEGLPFLLTLEPPWKNNQHDVSCISIGEYMAYRNPPTEKIPYEHFVVDVKDRPGIALHKGNTVKDTLGCILLGSKFNPLESFPQIQMSNDAYSAFMIRMAGHNKFKLVIQNA